MLAHSRVPMLRLLPDAAEPDLVARVTVGPPTRPPATAVMLAGAIPRRHTDRQALTKISVPTPRTGGS